MIKIWLSDTTKKFRCIKITGFWSCAIGEIVSENSNGQLAWNGEEDSILPVMRGLEWKEI